MKGLDLLPGVMPASQLGQFSHTQTLVVAMLQLKNGSILFTLLGASDSNSFDDYILYNQMTETLLNGSDHKCLSCTLHSFLVVHVQYIAYLLIVSKCLQFYDSKHMSPASKDVPLLESTQVIALKIGE